MKWLAVVWLFFCLTAENRSPIVERVAIFHSMIAAYVVWGLFTGNWNLNNIETVNQSVVVLGSAAAMMLIAIFSGLMVVRDREDRFSSFRCSSFFSRHRQIGYTCLFGCILLIGLSGYDIRYFWPSPLIVYLISREI